MEKRMIYIDDKLINIVLEQLEEKIRQLEDENTYLRLELDESKTENVNLRSVVYEMEKKIEELTKNERK
jgi:FtsZ-binding cell division protein ZapB